jgi:site-specific DNA recombinase
LVSVTEDIDTSTPSGRFLRTILLAVAEFESERLGEESRNVHARRRAAGIVQVTVPMLGYIIEKGRIVGVNERDAEAVRQAFSLRAGGAGLRKIALMLDERGVRPVRANGSGRGFTDTSLRRILSNPHYAGLLVDGDELREAAHEPIVDREMWERVQARRKVATAHQRKALLAGFAVCGSCGEKMWRGHGSKPGQYAYRCSARWRGITCPRPTTVRADFLDPYIEELFLGRFDPERMPNRGRLPRTAGAAHERKVAKLRRKVAEFDAALTRIADAHFVRQAMSAAEYDRQVVRYERERDGAVAEANRLAAAVKIAPQFDVTVLELFPSMPLDVRRDALRLALERVVVHPANGGKRSQPPTGRGRGGNTFDVSRVEVIWTS